jgi:hypothetical protein
VTPPDWHRNWAYIHQRAEVVALENDPVRLFKVNGSNLRARALTEFASTLGAFRHLACHHNTHHSDVIVVFWMGELCSARVEARSTSFGVAAESEKMGGPTLAPSALSYAAGLEHVVPLTRPSRCIWSVVWWSVLSVACLFHGGYVWG